MSGTRFCSYFVNNSYFNTNVKAVFSFMKTLNIKFKTKKI